MESCYQRAFRLLRDRMEAACAEGEKILRENPPSPPDARRAYLDLFGQTEDLIQALQQAHRDAEEIFLDTDELDEGACIKKGREGPRNRPFLFSVYSYPAGFPPPKTAVHPAVSEFLPRDAKPRRSKKHPNRRGVSSPENGGSSRRFRISPAGRQAASKQKASQPARGSLSRKRRFIPPFPHLPRGTSSRVEAKKQRDRLRQKKDR